MTCYFDAVHELVGGQIGGPTHGPVSKYRFHDGQTPPSEEEIQKKLAELQAAYPMRLLREERTSEDWALLILGSNSSDKAEILLLFIILRSSLLPYGLRRPRRIAPFFNLVKLSSDGV